MSESAGEWWRDIGLLLLPIAHCLPLRWISACSSARSVNVNSGPADTHGALLPALAVPDLSDDSRSQVLQKSPYIVPV